MAYTFEDQLNFLSTLLGDSNTDTDSQWPLAQRKTEINHAEKQFAKDSRIVLENATGTASSKLITVPSDWLETFVLYVTVGGVKYKVTNDREISPKRLEEANLYSGDLPYYYYWTYSGVRKITLVGSASLASAAYDLYYFRQPTTDLSANSDVSVIPEEYRKASVYKAASELLPQIGQYQRADWCLNRYNTLAFQAKEVSERLYMNDDPPRPDVTSIGSDDVTDRQGMGEW